MMENPYAAPSAEIGETRAAVEKFKFKFLDAAGQEAGAFSKKGEIRDDLLVLDKTEIPFLSVARTLRRENRLVLWVMTEDKPVSLALAVQSGPKGGKSVAADIKLRLDRRVSGYWAGRKRAQLESEGRGAQFRAEPCPHCGSTVELSGFERTPQAYCPYCDTIFTLGPEADPDERDFRICDGCGYYGRPETFQSLTIIYLIGGVIWRSRTLFVCHVCQRKEGRKSVFRNIWTLVGTPLALYRLSRAHARGSRRSANLRELDRANLLAQKGRLDEAEEQYQTILARVRHAAGVHYNRALARVPSSDWRGCLDAAQAALADCSNYGPAVPLVVKSLEGLGRAAEAQAFKARWDER